MTVSTFKSVLLLGTKVFAQMMLFVSISDLRLKHGELSSVVQK